MCSLKSFVDELSGEGLVVRKSKLKPYLEVTKELIESDLNGTTLLFEVEGSDLLCVGNVVNSRRKLYKALNASNDEEAYRKLLNVLGSNPPGVREFEDSFADYFTAINTDLSRLPFIKFFEGDGGMYITSSIVIARTPDLDSFNASIHRLMLVSNDRVAIRIVPRHLHRIVSLNSKLGVDTPVAVVIGVHPILLLLASLSPPYGVFEFDLARELIGGDLRFCRTPMYGLPVPCNSSVVMEGRIINEQVVEGPFLDLLGLYDRARKQPVIHVDRVYLNKHVEERLFHVILPGGMEHKLLMGFPKEAAIWDGVRRVVPKVHKVRLTPSGGCWLHAVISIDKNSDGDAKNAILAAFASHPSLKYVVVVDSDVDPDNLADVEWAIATRVQASDDLIIIRNARGSTLDPSSSDGITDKLGIDATAPVDSFEAFRRPKV
ncbi:MAG: UbiD family decarboxylase [Sulfolobales archaeon]